MSNVSSTHATQLMLCAGNALTCHYFPPSKSIKNSQTNFFVIRVVLEPNKSIYIFKKMSIPDIVYMKLVRTERVNYVCVYETTEKKLGNTFKKTGYIPVYKTKKNPIPIYNHMWKRSLQK